MSSTINRTLTTIALAITLAILGSWYLYNLENTSSGGLLNVSAGAPNNLSGFAWSSVAGWISFNCTNPGENCGMSDYGVHINESNRFNGGQDNIIGYAWIGNYDDKNNNGVFERVDEPFTDVNGNTVYDTGEPYTDTNGNGEYDTKEAITWGWVDFAPAGPYPASGPNYSSQIDWSSGNISGWARVISGCQGVPDTAASSCSSVGAGAATGNWDGWIKLRSTTGEPAYGVQLNGFNELIGYAWGANFIDEDWDGAGGVHPNGVQDLAGCTTADPNDPCEETLGIGWIRFSGTATNGSLYGVKFNPIGTPPPPGCGMAAGVPQSPNPPNTNLCSDGTNPPVSNNNTTPPYTWEWQCSTASGTASCSAPHAQCDDGADNDGDVKLDFTGPNIDDGCTSQSDNSERSFRFREF